MFDKMDEIRRSIRSEAAWLFKRQSVDGVFPVFYFFYSFKQGLPTCLDDSSLSDEGPDELQNKLYRAALGVFGGKTASFGKLQRMYAKMQNLGRAKFSEEYVRLIEEILCYTNLVGGTAELPNQRIATTIFNILREKRCTSVYTAYSGVGSYVVESRGISYHGAEPHETNNLIAEVIADAYRIESYSFDDTDPLTAWPRKKYDAIIGNLPVDVDFFDETRANRFLHEFNEKIDAFVKKLINNPKATMAAAVLSHFEFANYRAYDETRKMICKKGLLDTVIALPEDIFTLALVPTYLIILDMKGGRKEATFIDATNSKKSGSYAISDNRIDLRGDNPRKVSVSYTDIEKADWAFNPFVYIQDAACSEGQELVRIGDIADVTIGNTNKGSYFPPHLLSNKKKTVLDGAVPSKDVSPWGGSDKKVDGPSVLLNLSKGARREKQDLVLAICKDKGTFRTEFYVSVLKPNTEKILPEYLALALLSDPSFTRYFKQIQEYWTDPVRAGHLRERRIPVHTDLAVQRKMVDEALGRSSMEEAQYNVILAGLGKEVSSFEHPLSTFNFNILEVPERVEGPDGLEAILENVTKDGVSLTKRVDAIIFSTDLALSGHAKEPAFSGMDAVIDLQQKYHSRGIVFYAASGIGWEGLEKVFFPRRLKYFKEGHFFQTGCENGAAALVQALRQELDTLHSDSAQIRTKYRDVLAAADWIDATFAGNEVSEVLSDFLIAKEFGKDSLRKLSTLRTVAHNLIDILKKWNIVPDAIDLDQGAIPHLIYDQKFETKLTTYYYWDDKVMPKSLSSTLIALIEIGNEGTHTFNTDPQLGATMLNTLMAFILWLYNGRETLPARKTPWYKESKNERIQIDTIHLPLIGTVKKVSVKGKWIWVCGNVHLLEPADGDIREGDIVTITWVKPETKFKTPEINSLAYQDCYTIDKTRRK